MFSHLKCLSSQVTEIEGVGMKEHAPQNTTQLSVHQSAFQSRGARWASTGDPEALEHPESTRPGTSGPNTTRLALTNPLNRCAGGGLGPLPNPLTNASPSTGCAALRGQLNPQSTSGPWRGPVWWQNLCHYQRRHDSHQAGAEGKQDWFHRERIAVCSFLCLHRATPERQGARPNGDGRCKTIAEIAI